MSARPGVASRADAGARYARANAVLIATLSPADLAVIAGAMGVRDGHLAMSAA